MQKDSAQDIKFAPKHKGLMLAVAVANGTVLIYQWQDPNNLTTFTEFREINVLNNGECTCLSWNPDFVKSMSIVIGCMITSKSSSLENTIPEIDDDYLKHKHFPYEVNLLQL